MNNKHSKKCTEIGVASINISNKWVSNFIETTTYQFHSLVKCNSWKTAGGKAGIGGVVEVVKGHILKLGFYILFNCQGHIAMVIQFS